MAIFILSAFFGLSGTVWNIYGSFDALKSAESAGIGSVSSGIQNALFSTIFGLIGSAAGIILILVGGFKAYRR